MTHEEILKATLEEYFKGGNWREYLKALLKEVKGSGNIDRNNSEHSVINTSIDDIKHGNEKN